MSTTDLTAPPAAPVSAPPPAAGPAVPATAPVQTVLLRIAAADEEVLYRQVPASAAREQALEDAHAHGGAARIYAVTTGPAGLPVSERHAFDVDLAAIAPVTLTSAQDQRAVRELCDLLDRAGEVLAGANVSDGQIATLHAHAAELRAARSSALAGAFSDGKAPE